MLNNIILLSIHPQHANKIFKGTKTVELRRNRPKHLSKGALVLIYITSPIKSIAGAFKIEKVIEKPLKELWKIVHNKAGVTREEFDSYYSGISAGVGIFFSTVYCIPEPIKLKCLKEQITDFHPPQGFRYIKTSELEPTQIFEIIKRTYCFK